MFRYLPEQASEIAPDIDNLHNWITDISVFFTIAIVGSMLYFVIRYRQRDGVDHETPRIEGNALLEVIWTVVPTIVILFIAYYGTVVYLRLVKVPEDALHVTAHSRKWQWDFEYENGKRVSHEMVIPVNRPVKIALRSTDVLHSLFIPAMRVKNDAIPGMFTYVTFKPIKTGTYQAYCAEYCGTDHSKMLAKVHVVSEAEYMRWVNDRSDELAKLSASPLELGKKLYTEQGCHSCHSINGSKMVGPTFLKLFGSERTFTDGSKLKADENYIQDSILTPGKNVVQGYSNVMTAFATILDDRDIEGLIAFIRSLDGSQPVEEIPVEVKEDIDLSKLSPVERGERIFKNPAMACFTCHSLDGSKLVGPSLKGIYGRKGKLVSGAEYEADDKYIKSSITDPASQVVEGYAPVMPPFAGRTDEELNDLIEYMKSVQ